MLPEFLEEVAGSQSTPFERPVVQAKARAIQESTKPLPRRETQGGLAYPYPGKGVAGETSN